MERKPILVGLPMNVLSYQLRDNIPTKLAAFERLVHESQSSEIVNDDVTTGVTVLRMEDMRVQAHLMRNSVRIASWTQMREEILEIPRTQHYTDSQSVSMQIDTYPKRQGQGYKEQVVQESEKGTIREGVFTIRGQVT